VLSSAETTPCNEVVQACEEAVEAQQRVIDFQDKHIDTLKTLNLTSSKEIERLRLKHDTKWNPWVIGIIGFLGGALTYSVVK
jgi:hypothetical protein